MVQQQAAQQQAQRAAQAQQAARAAACKKATATTSNFSVGFGYTLKYFILEDLEQAKPWLLKFTKACEKPSYVNFKGYSVVFEAIAEHDVDKANQGFEEINKGHIKDCKGRGYRWFKDTELEDLNTWGVGMANLCRYYGLDTQIDHTLIPAELLIEVRK